MFEIWAGKLSYKRWVFPRLHSSKPSNLGKTLSNFRPCRVPRAALVEKQALGEPAVYRY